MSKRLTITLDADIYEGLHSIVGQDRISRSLNDLARAHVVAQDVSAGYAAMTADEAREAEDWTEGLVGDVAAEWRGETCLRRLSG